MRHSTQLAQDMKRKLPVLIAHGRITAEDGARLGREVHMRELVLQALHLGTTGRLFWRARVWLAYMQRHARLQIQREAGAIDEETFHRRCGELRRWRDQLFRNPWKEGGL